MLTSFISGEFLVFILAVWALYLIVKKEYRVAMLLVASLLFVALINPLFLIYGLIYSVINYLVGRFIQHGNSPYRRLVYLSAQVFNIGCLVFFKYVTIIVANIAPSLVPANDVWFLLPLGISYYSFQSISYLYLIFKGAEKAENSFVRFALYLLFFPKFIAGPIERSKSFLPQLQTSYTPNYADFSQGIRLFMWGAFKKIVIANTLGIMVHKMYGGYIMYESMPVSLALIFQSSYMYADFSGYTDMALGLGRIFGIKLSPNFNNPFGAQTIGEFWRKWHISLSSWCNDFIYNRIMLKYRRSGNKAAFYGISTTFLIIGVWHGANMTFVVLGALQALVIIYEFYSKSFRKRFSARFNPTFYKVISVIWVNLFFTFSLIFFFSANVNSAWGVIQRVVATPFTFNNGFGFNINKVEFLFVLFSLTLVYFIEFGGRNHPLIKRMMNSNLLRFMLYFIWFLLIAYFSKNQIVFNYAGF